ncbi:MAG: S8 family serine peptidase, partial [Pseudomonadota bacterium]
LARGTDDDDAPRIGARNRLPHGPVHPRAAVEEGQVIDRIVYPARYPQTIAVGGYDETGQDRVHYPLGGYAAPDPVDVWTRAVRINRASGRRPGEGDEIEADPDGIARVYAEDDPKFAGNASGTSYAAAQVAAAAALWSEHWHDRLTRAPFDGAPWKRVEAFRAALRALPEERISNGRALGGSVRVRRLDVEALLNREPGTDAPLERRPDRGRGFF